MSNRIASLGLVLAMATLIPSVAAAQQDRSTREIDVAKAESMEEEARFFSQDLRDLGRAARLLRDAAEYRPIEDSIAVTDLATSARLSFYRKQFREARRTMLRAAERALSIGDVDHAANYFVDAAHLSVELNDGPGARNSLERARLLSHSPLLTAVQVARLTSRIGPAPTVVADNRDDGGR